MEKCFSCKASNQLESMYCIKCGIELKKLYFCENCNVQYDNSLLFCPNDGGSIFEKKLSELIGSDLDSFKSTTKLVKLLKVSFLLNFFFPFIASFVLASFIPVSSSIGAYFLVILLVFLLPLTTIIIYFRWLYVSSKNLAALSIRNTRFSPSTTLLWYFIPIINIVMMYSSMKEIWIYSENPINPKIKENKPQLVLDWATLVFLCITPFSFFAIWFLIYVTIKMTTQISELQNKSFQRLKGIELSK